MLDAAPPYHAPSESPGVSLLGEVPQLVALAVPIVAGLAGSTVLSVIDSLMLGPLGEVSLAAASLTQSILVVFYAGLYGVVGPVGIFVGQAHGAGENLRISGLLRHGLVIAFVSGLLGALAMAAFFPVLEFTGQPREVMIAMPAYWVTMSFLLLPFTLCMVVKLFLDAIGRPWVGAILILIPVVLNIPLNWLLIYGNLGFPRLGLLGAAVSSLSAVSAGFVLMLLYVRLAPSMGNFRSAARLRSAGFSELMREGCPMAIQYLSEGGAIAVAGVLVGLLGSTALAANQIVFSVAVLVYMAPLGLSGAVSIRIAQSHGKGATNRLRSIGLAGIAVSTVWTLMFAILMVCWGEVIARAFVDDASVIAAATAMFWVIGMMQIFDGLQSVSLGALRGLLDNRWPTCVSIFSNWLIALPLSILFGFNLGYGAPGIWAGFGMGLAVAGGLFLWRFLSITRHLGTCTHIDSPSPAGRIPH
ncbi:MAG: MATE family efflux transporter [Hyphomicrobium sp.]